ANGPDRCARCKTALMDALTPIAIAESATVVLGVNLDDLGDHRPGQSKASELGARFPLVRAGFDKAAVREWSRRLGLRTWDKPAAACLSSRIAYGTPVTLGSLRSIATAEEALKALGFAQLRVRHHGSLARIEVEVDALEAVLVRRSAVIEAVREAGYVYVTLDLAGFRSGSMNEVLAKGDD
ncbi:MAG: ATP-dependent sacrificial sulfur transferase LarE, partial [Acidimicrobiales bacterium]